MRKLFRETKQILNNESGVALIMIMTSIILLMAIYGEFTFESKISRIKATNIMDRSQAKLLAESGLQLAMTRLKLYKEAYNRLEQNQAAKQQVPAQLLNQLWEVPFMFPIPMGKDVPITAKSTIEKFEKETLLEGTMKVTIQNISNRMNLNMMRVDMVKRSQAYAGDPNYIDPNSDGIIDGRVDAIQNNVSVDQSLFFIMKRLVDEKKEKDPGFEDRHANIDYLDLISNLRYYISDYGSLQTDPNASEAMSTFDKLGLTPKYGPLSSASELYAIPLWDDELIELIQNEFSVYPSTQIDLNKLTNNMIKILLPTITEDQTKAFFEYRDDPQRPKFFNSVEDFRRWAVDVERVVSEQTFKDRMDKFRMAGITFGSNPNLFKIVSEGGYNRSTYTLVAYVNMPKQENGTAAGGVTGGATSGAQGGVNAGVSGQTSGGAAGGTTGGASGATGAQPVTLLDPRIIEIQIN